MTSKQKKIRIEFFLNEAIASTSKGHPKKKKDVNLFMKDLVQLEKMMTK